MAQSSFDKPARRLLTPACVELRESEREREREKERKAYLLELSYV